jgi:hypothetical protein
LRGAVGAINGGADANGCTAVGAYNNNDTIRFSLGTATITLASAANNYITILRPLTVDGSGNDITLDGNNTTRIFTIRSGCTELTIKRLTFINGYAPGSDGGAIAVEINAGDTPNALIVEDSAFMDNRAGGGIGGAIDITDGGYNIRPPSTLLVERSTFIGNKADIFGGAIWAYSATIRDSTFSNNASEHSIPSFGRGGAVWADAAEITNSTFVGNAASSVGGAIYIASDLAANRPGLLTATHLTLVNNNAPTGAAVHVAAGGTASLRNSLIVGGSSIVAAQCAAEANATLSSGTNLEWRDGINENSCNSSAPVTATVTLPEDIVNTVLANHGGPTLTLALPDNSPAIDTGDPSTGLATDQRGQPRPRGSGYDLGAFEAQPRTPPTLTAVPALSVWSLLALLGLVSAVGCRERRRI